MVPGNCLVLALPSVDLSVADCSIYHKLYSRFSGTYLNGIISGPSADPRLLCYAKAYM